MSARFSGSPSAGPAGCTGEHRSTQRHAPRGRDGEDRLVAAMIELSLQYRRYGYRRIAALLARDGLRVPARQPKRRRLWLNDGSCVRLRAGRPGHAPRQSPDCRPAGKRAIRLLTDDGPTASSTIAPMTAGPSGRPNVLDAFTRESLTIRVPRKLSPVDVIDVLTDLFIRRDPPAFVRSDNGPEFVAKAVQRWVAAVGARTAFIQPGSPWENGYIQCPFPGRAAQWRDLLFSEGGSSGHRAMASAL